MNANDAMLKVAKIMADKYGYKKIDVPEEIDACEDSFWGNKRLGEEASEKGQKITVKTCRYELPTTESNNEEQKRIPHIRIDMFWGNPRLSMYLPNGSFACITYKDNEMSEAQAFKSDGITLAGVFKFLIDEEIKNNSL